MSKFVHLHVHSQFSILDGASSIKGLVEKAKGMGMNALALTDHGNMFGVKEFVNTVAKVNDPISKEIKRLKSEINALKDDSGSADKIS
ncbi:MAG TPA: PHP domain-containing protein, partial [Tenuifilaceae bacterium]|nr:PHP domain-containing protein [Tenuifilaceae bacterium]